MADDRLGVQFLIDTGPAGRRDVVLRICDPATVTLRPIDAVTHAPVQLGNDAFSLSCRLNPWPLLAARRFCGVFGPPEWNGTVEAWELRVAAGEIEFVLDGESNQADALLTIAPGHNQLTLPVMRR